MKRCKKEEEIWFRYGKKTTFLGCLQISRSSIQASHILLEIASM